MHEPSDKKQEVCARCDKYAPELEILRKHAPLVEQIIAELKARHEPAPKKPEVRAQDFLAGLKAMLTPEQLAETERQVEEFERKMKQENRLSIEDLLREY